MGTAGPGALQVKERTLDKCESSPVSASASVRLCVCAGVGVVSDIPRHIVIPACAS